MKKLFVLIALTCVFFSKSQTKVNTSYKDFFLEGSYLLLEENYPLALENFESAYKFDSLNANINYLIGICHLNSSNGKLKAEYFLSKAIKNVSRSYKTDEPSEKAAAPLAHLYYGQALHINYKFDEAIAQYNEFKKYFSAKDKEWNKIVEKEKATSIYAKELTMVPLDVKITNLGDSVNSIYPDYSPVLSADERMLIFTTRRPNTTGGYKEVNGLYNEDIVVCYKDINGKWSSPVSISPNINTSGMEAAINLTPDGQTLIIYKDGGEGMGGNIYYSNFDGRDWTPLKEFGSDVNTKYHESHACLSSDGNVLFFVSDRPGGFGGKDIYRCIKLANGKWSKALNMGSVINTEYDEDGAFIHPNGNTFFFSSNGHNTMGGYDIFFATLNSDNKFSDVTNIGYPINTPEDDVFYLTSPDGKRGYFSSAKEGGYGEKDIYVITINKSVEEPLVLFKGQIVAADGDKLPEDISVSVTDKHTGEIIGFYRPKLVNGTFATILPPNREYNFSYQTATGEEFYNEDIFVNNEISYQEINREIDLEPVKLGEKIAAKKKTIILNPIVFDNAKNKKLVSSAKLTLQEKNGVTQIFSANSQGKYEPIGLNPDNNYLLFAENNGKKSAVSEITTVGIKSAKVINQILYLDGKSPDKVVNNPSTEALLDVVVKNSKSKKGIENAMITLTDPSGGKIEALTDAKGNAKNISIERGVKYKLVAFKDASTSEELYFIAPDKKSPTKFTKQILLDNNVEIINVKNNPVSNSVEGQYSYYFKYNKRDIDEAENTWTTFIDNLVTLSKQKNVKVSIRSCASHVPCRIGNKKLALSRAKKLQAKINEAVTAKGGNGNNITFTKSATVAGPEYKGDYKIGRKKYEKFQFVKAKIN